MTEEEWRVCDDPERMLPFVERCLNERQKRLFAAACCRRVWPMLADQRSRRAVEVLEYFADGQVPAEDLFGACEDAKAADEQAPRRMHHAAYAVTDATADLLRLDSVVLYCALAAGHQALLTEYNDAAFQEAEEGDDDHPYNVLLNAHAEEEAFIQAVLLEDISGNPFRPIRFSQSWQTPAVAALVREIYSQRAFDRMPELATMLEEAGCSEPTILEHCREEELHARGCWVLEGLLQPGEKEWETLDASLWGKIEWLWLHGKISPRKLRLFGVACYRRAAPDAPEECWKALEVAERYADSKANWNELRQARTKVNEWLAAHKGDRREHAAMVAACVVGVVPLDAGTIPLQLAWTSGEGWHESTSAGQEALLEEVVGNPFREALNPDWLTALVQTIAKTIYEEKDFAAMPVLADALEEAGCTNRELLGHLRGSGMHIRGCWALDDILTHSASSLL
jgi:hypothetical protein